MAAMMERIAKATAYKASSVYHVNQQGKTADGSRLSISTLLSRSDTLCVSAVLADPGVAALLALGTSPTYLAGMIADWITTRHHQTNHSENVNHTCLYGRDAVESARIKLAAAPAEQPVVQLSECLSDFDHQRIFEDWDNDAVKKAIRAYKSECHLKPFVQRLQLLNYGGMDCFQDIFLDAAKIHITQVTRNADKQVTSAYRLSIDYSPVYSLDTRQLMQRGTSSGWPSWSQATVPTPRQC